MSDFEQDFILSDEERASLTFDEAKRVKLRFGQYKGKRLAQLIRNSKGRQYLKYLLTWDKLRDDMKQSIEVCLEAYEKFKQEKNTVIPEVNKQQKKK